MRRYFSHTIGQTHSSSYDRQTHSSDYNRQLNLSNYDRRTHSSDCDRRTHSSDYDRRTHSSDYDRRTYSSDYDRQTLMNEFGDDHNSYNFAEMRRARDMLIKEVDYGILQGLGFDLRKFSSCNRAIIPNVWEGDNGMMEHISSPFPMPGTSNVPEESFNEPHDSDFHDTLTADCIPQVSYENWTEEYSEMPVSRGMAFDPEASVLLPFDPTSGDLDCEFSEKQNYSTGKEKRYDNMSPEEVKEMEFWLRVAKVHYHLHGMNLSLTKIVRKIYDPNQRIHGCQELAVMYRKVKLIKSQVTQAERQFKICKFRNIFLEMSGEEKSIFKKLHKIKGKLPNKFINVVTSIDKFCNRIRKSLRHHRYKIKPYRDILNSAINDLLLTKQTPIHQPLLDSENEDCDNMELPMKDSFNKYDTIGEPSTVNHKVSDDENTLESDKYLSVDHQGLLDTSAVYCQLDKMEKTHSVSAVIENTDQVGASEQCLSDINNLDTNLSSCVQMSDSLEHPGTLDPSECLFWKNLAELRTNICNTVLLVKNISGLFFTIPQSRQGKVNIAPIFEKMVNAYHKINSLSTVFKKLQTEMVNKNYPERGPFGLKELQCHVIGVKPNCSSIEIVEALLKKLQGLYARIRLDKHSLLNQLGFVKAKNELTLNVAGTKLVRFCSHSELSINIATLRSIKKRNCQQNKPITGPIPSTSSTDQNTVPHQDNETGNDLQNSATGGDTALNSNLPVLPDSASVANASIQCDPPQSCPPTDTTKIHQVKNSAISDNLDFIIEEIKHWDRLQIMYKGVERLINKFKTKSGKQWFREKHMRKFMNKGYNEYRKYRKQLNFEMYQNKKKGYCKKVNYKNVERQSKNAVHLLLKDLNQLKFKVNDLKDLFTQEARHLGVLHLYKI